MNEKRELKKIQTKMHKNLPSDEVSLGKIPRVSYWDDTVIISDSRIGWPGYRKISKGRY